MTFLSLSRVSKTFSRGSVAVDDLSFNVGNELLVLMGPSGSGKSTTLRMIAGLERPTAGEIYLAGKAITTMPSRRRGVAMVFQQGSLFPHLTVRGNLEFGLRLRRVPRDERARRIDEAAANLEIGRLLDRRPRELSGGEQQRVALGRAMVQKPRLFLLDEPLSNLNVVLRLQLRQMIRDLQVRLGTPMIYVTHDPQEAMALGTRIGILQAGRLQQIGAPLELFDNPGNRVVAAALGTPGMNFLEGRVEGDGGLPKIAIGHERLLTADRWRGELSSRVGQPIVVGLRPEHVVLARSKEECAGFQLTADVQAVENFGSERQARLRSSGQSFIARLADGIAISENSRVDATVADEHVYLFDAETGNRVRET